MGVSGCGKTTIGTQLARDLGWEFLEGDDYHPPENKEKMKQGQPLTEADRLPWLSRLAEAVRVRSEGGQDAVLACSALTRASRDLLRRSPGVRFVHLIGSFELIRSRLAGRQHSFMDPGLLASQFETLEPPSDAVEVDVGPSPAEVTRTILAMLASEGSTGRGA